MLPMDTSSSPSAIHHMCNMLRVHGLRIHVRMTHPFLNKSKSFLSCVAGILWNELWISCLFLLWIQKWPFDTDLDSKLKCWKSNTPIWIPNLNAIKPTHQFGFQIEMLENQHPDLDSKLKFWKTNTPIWNPNWNPIKPTHQFGIQIGLFVSLISSSKQEIKICDSQQLCSYVIYGFCYCHTAFETQFQCMEMCRWSRPHTICLYYEKDWHWVPNMIW